MDKEKYLLNLVHELQKHMVLRFCKNKRKKFPGVFKLQVNTRIPGLRKRGWF